MDLQEKQKGLLQRFIDQGKLMQELQRKRPPLNSGMFTVLDANKWLARSKDELTPAQLLNELLHEGEVCILFADTGMGKSIFAVQCGEHISGGTRIPGFRATTPQKVLYIDFELTAKQREIRYSEKDAVTGTLVNPHHFSDKLYFAQIDANQLPPAEFEDQGFEAWLSYSIESAITDTGAKVIIIDNITYLSTEQERAKDALPLMKELKELKNKYSLTILCLAHTPKRDNSKPINKNDLQGSKMLINFCDSAFAIAESTSDKSIRYIKQIKARNTEIVYDSNNVMVFRIVKAGSFLHFEFMDFGRESDHLMVTTEDKEQIAAEVLRMHMEHKSYGQIADTLNLNKMRVKRIPDKIKADDRWE
jgi:RecA-family ATPase